MAPTHTGTIAFGPTMKIESYALANGLRPTYIGAAGNEAGAAEIANPTVRMSYYWLAGVEVVDPREFVS